MDPLSIAAACVGLLSGLTAVSTKIRSLTIDAKNTNKEVSALQSELDSFQRSLGVFYGSGLADDYPNHLRADLDKISVNVNISWMTSSICWTTSPPQT